MKNSDFEKSKADADAMVLWRFNVLKALGIVEDRATLRRWMATRDSLRRSFSGRTASRGTQRKRVSG
jgi:hypothetical protein